MSTPPVGVSKIIPGRRSDVVSSSGHGPQLRLHQEGMCSNSVVDSDSNCCSMYGIHWFVNFAHGLELLTLARGALLPLPAFRCRQAAQICLCSSSA